jgi:DNA (cytosine-5)-methyltransferase 1
VFVVGYLGDWRVAAAVLFERESLQGNTKPSRKKREEAASDVEGSVGEAGQVVIDRAAFNQGENARFEPRIEIEETMSALVARGPHAVAQPIAIQDIRPIEKAQNGRGWNDDGTSYTIDTKATQGVAQPIGVDFYNQCITGDTFQTVSTRINASTTGGVMHSMAIRRLTPKECERLQGFPDDWTKIPYRNKEADQCPDGPRYKACGNSMAVPVMQWIGERINLIESML